MVPPECDVVFIGSDGMSVTVSRAQFLRASDFALPPPSSLGNDSVVFHAAENIDVLKAFIGLFDFKDVCARIGLLCRRLTKLHRNPYMKL